MSVIYAVRLHSAENCRKSEFAGRRKLIFNNRPTSKFLGVGQSGKSNCPWPCARGARTSSPHSVAAMSREPAYRMAVIGADTR